MNLSYNLNKLRANIFLIEDLEIGMNSWDSRARVVHALMDFWCLFMTEEGKTFSQLYPKYFRISFNVFLVASQHFLVNEK